MTATATLSPGDAVRRRGRLGVVYRVTGDRLVVWPVYFRPQTRVADVPVTGFMDRALLGAGRGDAVVAVWQVLDMAAADQERIGRLSDPALRTIAAAFRREAG